jgi:hypothetical protein
MANESKNAFLLTHHAPNNKSKIVVHPTNHGDNHLGPTQQPAINPLH